MEIIRVKTSSLEGDIYVGEGVLAERLPRLTEGQRNFVVTDSNVYAIYRKLFQDYFANADVFVLPAGEESKNFQSLYQILRKMAKVGLCRTSRLFAVGGGVVGDIGGLAAALYMRGVSYVQIPTTLLAQLDSSVGGKTAVDLGEIKNVVGAFYQPCEVLVDPTFLQTLSAREWKCGIGELVKYGALSGEIFDALTKNLALLTDKAFVTSMITPCIRHKVRVVQADEKETGERRSLNVGHTTAHAIELGSGLSHGESVLYGMLLETRIAISKGVCEKDYGEQLLQIVESALKLSPNEPLVFANIVEAAEKARADKKNTDENNVTMSVASMKNAWTALTLPFAEYRAALKEQVEKLQEKV